MNLPKKDLQRENVQFLGLRIEKHQHLMSRWERMSLQRKLRKYQQKDEEKLEKMNEVKRQSVSRRKW